MGKLGEVFEKPNFAIKMIVIWFLLATITLVYGQNSKIIAQETLELTSTGNGDSSDNTVRVFDGEDAAIAAFRFAEEMQVRNM